MAREIYLCDLPVAEPNSSALCQYKTYLTNTIRANLVLAQNATRRAYLHVGGAEPVSLLEAAVFRVVEDNAINNNYTISSDAPGRANGARALGFVVVAQGGAAAMVSYSGGNNGYYTRASGNSAFIGVVSDAADPVQIVSMDYDRTYIVVSYNSRYV